MNAFGRVLCVVDGYEGCPLALKSVGSCRYIRLRIPNNHGPVKMEFAPWTRAAITPCIEREFGIRRSVRATGECGSSQHTPPLSAEGGPRQASRRIERRFD